MKQYNLLLVYNDEETMKSWMEDKKSKAQDWIYKVKDRKLILKYNEDPFQREPLAKTTEVVWYIRKYDSNAGKNSEWVNRFMGSEFHFVHYLDGMIKAEDIMYLICRTRLGVREV